MLSDEDTALLALNHLSHSEAAVEMARLGHSLRSRDSIRRRRERLSTLGHTVPDWMAKRPPRLTIPKTRFPKAVREGEVTIKADGFVVVSDIHAPYQHGPFLTNLFRLAQAWNIDTVVLNGDTFDKSAFKSFPGDRGDASLEQEMAVVEEIVAILCRHFGRIVITRGNHEDRFLSRLLNNQLFVDRWQRLFTTDAKVEVINLSYVFGDSAGTKWIFGHPDNYSKVPGKTPADIQREKYPLHNVCAAHNHQVGRVLLRNHEGIFRAVDPGCGCDPSRLRYVERSFNSHRPMNVGALLIKGAYDYPVDLTTDWDAMTRLYGAAA